MNNKKIIFLLVMGIVISMVPVASASEAQTVEVEGMVSVNSGTLAQVKEKAINKGLRRAVEQVAGAFISSTTKTKNAKLIKDEISKNSQGYVKSYKVLHKEIANSIYKVRLRVKVGIKNLSEDVEALKMNIKRHGNPRIMILFSQVKEGYSVNVSPSVVETELMDEFISSGYQVIDRHRIKQVVSNEQRKSILGGNYQLASQLGSQLKADFIVVGDARASYVDLSDVFNNNASSGLESYNAQIDAKVVNAATAQVIAAVNSDGQGAGPNKESAVKKAFVKASKNVSNSLIDKVSKDIIQEEKTIKVKISGVDSLSKLSKLKNVFPTLTGVKNSYFREYGGNLANFDLDLKTTTKTLDLAVELEQKVDFSFEIKNMSESKLMLKIK